MNRYRLPTGEVTGSKKKYVRAWREMAAQVAEVLGIGPLSGDGQFGWFLHAFDPGVYFKTREFSGEEGALEVPNSVLRRLMVKTGDQPPESKHSPWLRITELERQVKHLQHVQDEHTKAQAWLERRLIDRLKEPK